MKTANVTIQNIDMLLDHGHVSKDILNLFNECIGGVRTLRRRTLRRNFSYLRVCGTLVLIDDMIYNYTKSCNKHNQLIMWSLLRLNTKILKEACGDPPEARKKKHFIKDGRILIVLSWYFSYFVILYS